ncbi:MAG: hypothetical protein SVV67_00525 [Bacillota bacterium]|nr:hypothetical protein [Bacillota bacterium]
MCRVAMTGVGVKAPACSGKELFRNNIDYEEYATSAADEILRDSIFASLPAVEKMLLLIFVSSSRMERMIPAGLRFMFVTLLCRC